MIRERVMEGAGFLPDGREDIYKIEGEDLFAVGTSEQALAGLHDGEIVEVGQLPLRYGGVSPCFRTEVGSHGRDTKGIFRVHQFEKVEMFAFTLPENSWQEHEEMLVIAEDILKDLRVPYRVVNVCTGELSSVVAKRYDIEAWLPGQEKYREVVSCSNCTDYQARRLGIRYRKAPGEPTSFVHTLNSTALASSRTLIAVLENYQTADGRVVVPDVLRPLMAKMEIIEKG
jgi:seryl-tRNA synthetase